MASWLSFIHSKPRSLTAERYLLSPAASTVKEASSSGRTQWDTQRWRAEKSVRPGRVLA